MGTSGAVLGEFNIDIDNHLDEIGRLADAVEGFLAGFATPPAAVYRLNLALEELLVNTISYGLPTDQHRVIHVRLRRESSCIVTSIDDDGIAFNPFDQPDADTTLSIEERNIGGLGIRLVRETMSELDYQRIGDRNLVTLKLLIPDQAPSLAKGTDHG